MQSFSLTCHLYPKLLSRVFQAGSNICPSPGCLSSASCPRQALMPGSISRPFVSLLFSVCQAKAAGLIFPIEISDSFLSPTLLPAHTRSLIESWLLPGFLVSPSSCAWSSGTPPILLQIPSPHGLWIYRPPAKVCLIHSLPHPCKHAGQHNGFS